MKKILCTAAAALLVTGSITAFAGQCPCSEKNKADKSAAETTAQQQPAATSEASA